MMKPITFAIVLAACFIVATQPEQPASAAQSQRSAEPQISGDAAQYIRELSGYELLQRYTNKRDITTIEGTFTLGAISTGSHVKRPTVAGGTTVVDLPLVSVDSCTPRQFLDNNSQLQTPDFNCAAKIAGDGPNNFASAVGNFAEDPTGKFMTGVVVRVGAEVSSTRADLAKTDIEKAFSLARLMKVSAKELIDAASKSDPTQMTLTVANCFKSIPMNGAPQAQSLACLGTRAVAIAECDLFFGYVDPGTQQYDCYVDPASAIVAITAINQSERAVIEIGSLLVPYQIAQRALQLKEDHAKAMYQPPHF